jgi:predicted Zn-dependent peptidase
MYRQIKFPNGFKLIIVPQNKTEIITVLILLPIGSRYEPNNLNGASHFIEHMMFKGTSRRPDSLSIAKELDGLGAEYNAFTGKEYTGYWVKTTQKKAEIALDVLSDMLFNSVFKKEEFEQERGVILEEIKMYKENPLLYIDDLFESSLYFNHSLGKLISGEENDVKKMNREELLKYKKMFYLPGQMVMAIAGGINKNKIIKSAERYFGHLKNKKQNNKFKPFLPAQKSKNRVNLIFKKNLKQAQIALGGLAYPYNHPNNEALRLLLVILGGNMSSRLFTEVRVKRGLVYTINADSETYQDIGKYGIFAGVDKDRIMEAIEVILDELKKIKKFGITKEELIRAKNYIDGSLNLQMEDSASLAKWYAKQSLFAKKISTPKERLKKIKKVTSDNIKKIANQLFNGKILVIIGPFKNKKPFLRILEKKV